MVSSALDQVVPWIVLVIILFIGVLVRETIKEYAIAYRDRIGRFLLVSPSATEQRIDDLEDETRELHQPIYDSLGRIEKQTQTLEDRTERIESKVDQNTETLDHHGDTLEMHSQIMYEGFSNEVDDERDLRDALDVETDPEDMFPNDD